MYPGIFNHIICMPSLTGLSQSRCIMTMTMTFKDLG